MEEADKFLNGLNTQGENIADNGGIKQSYYAYRNLMTSIGGEEDETMPGLEHLSGDQLFFLNFAQVWCGSTRKEALHFILKTGVHAPGKYRQENAHHGLNHGKFPRVQFMHSVVVVLVTE